MTILKIRQQPDPILRDIAAEVITFDEELQKLAADMFETMRISKGVGLSAPQVGRSIRLLITHIDGRTLKLVNPVIINRTGQQRSIEGCLSVSKSLWGRAVIRSLYVEVAYKRLNGEGHTIKANKKMAACVQHEIDHLNGILYTDYVLDIRSTKQFS